MTIEKVIQLRDVANRLRLSDRRSWILMVPNSIGEVVTICGFAKAFTEKHSHGITLVIRDVHKNLPQFYPGRFNAVITMSLELMRDLSNYGIINPNDFVLDVPFNTWPEQNGDGRLLEIHQLLSNGNSRGGLTYFDMYRHILRLDWNSPIEKGYISSELRTVALKYCEDHGITRGKSVILFPGGNTNKPAPGVFWEAISKFYRNNGIDVYVNFRGSDFRPNTNNTLGTELDLPIDLAVAVSEYAGNLVTAVNGLVMLVLMVGLKCNINVALSDQYDPQRSGVFKHLNPLSGCHLLIAPEVAVNHDSYYEWVIRSDAAVAELEDIAKSIVNNLLHPARIDKNNIAAHTNSNYGIWAQDLVRDWS
jgi:hypothetical protein